MIAWPAARLGAKALLAQPRLALSTIAILFVPLVCALLFDGYHARFAALYLQGARRQLVVHESGSMGEFLGSRFAAARAADVALAAGAEPIPYIHTVTGATPATAILLRGVDPARYPEADRFDMRQGEALSPASPPRSAMIGAQLARDRQLAAGDDVEVRGRNFTVLGVFETGTYADFEVWMPLVEAQALLGWQDEISALVFPADTALRAGDTLPGGLSVLQRGSSGESLVAEWRPILETMQALTLSLAAWAAISLAITLWRMAWLERRSLAILRAVGYDARAIAGFVLAQALALTGSALLIAIPLAALIGQLRLETAGIYVQAVPSGSTLLVALALSFTVCIFGAAWPTVLLYRQSPAALLRGD